MYANSSAFHRLTEMITNQNDSFYIVDVHIKFRTYLSILPLSALSMELFLVSPHSNATCRSPSLSNVLYCRGTRRQTPHSCRLNESLDLRSITIAYFELLENNIHKY